MTQAMPDDLWRDFPKTATEFEARFATEEDCRAYWIEARWGGEPACARCNSTRMWTIREGTTFECAYCGHQTSLTSGTSDEGDGVETGCEVVAVAAQQAEVVAVRVLGLFLIIAGVAMVLRWRFFMPVIGTFVEERLTRVIYAFIELLAGLFLVMGHNVWSPAPAAIITFIGRMAVVEATAYLLLPDETMERFVRSFNVPAWYVGGGIAVIALGAYLAAFGFGWI